MEKILLVLDLDETLIHGTDEREEIDRLGKVRPADRILSYKGYSDLHIWKRPHLEDFIEKTLKWFNVAVWTNSSEDYAEEVVSLLFPRREELQFVWARSRGVISVGYYDHRHLIKPLEKILRKGYRKERVLAVDDTPAKWARSYSNHVTVKEFNGDPEDKELKDLLKYLDWIRHEDNVRPVDKRRWRDHVSLRGLQQ